MANYTITVIPGDGIGPDITESVLSILRKLDCQLNFEFAQAGQKSFELSGELLPEFTLDLIRKNKVVLKGPLMTPVGGGFTSVNVALRKTFDLFANVRPVVTYPGTISRYEDIDLFTIRENTEGMYSGEGQSVTADGKRAESKSVVTQAGSERVIEYAFKLAQDRKRRRVTLLHKANILKSTSGLFLEVGRKVAQRFPDIEYNEMIIDAASMYLVMDPHRFDVIVTTNLFGDIISDLCAGLVGGLGMAPGANIGKEVAIFEAVHGSAPDIAGKNLANPCSLLFAATLMLEHLDLYQCSHRVKSAVREVLTKKDRVTPDLGGTGTTTSMTEAILERL